MAYRNYVTDGLYALVNGGGLAFTRRFAEIMEPEQEKPNQSEKLTQEEIVDKVWSAIER